MKKIKHYAGIWFAYDRSFFLLITGITIFVYTFSWRNEFVSDDIAGIAQNPGIGNLWQQITSTNINNIVYSIIYVAFGPTPFWFHLNNTIAHIATIFLVYAVIWLISTSKWLSRVVTLLFALHPVQTEVVTWISGYSYTAYTFFSLATLFVFMLVDKKIIRQAWIWTTALLLLLALRSSEKSVILPGILALYIVFFSKISFRKLFLLIPTASVGTVYVMYLFSNLFKRIEYVNPSSQGSDTIVYNPLLQIPTAIGTYIKLLLVPVNLTLYHEFIQYSPGEYIGNVVLTIIVLALLFVCWKYNRLASFGIALFLTSLAPTLLPINVGWIVAERYVHFGSIGFFLAFAALTYELLKKFRIREEHVLTGMAVLAVILGGLTVRRNLEWRSQDTLWPVTVKRSPYSAYAHNNMGDYYGRHGDVQNSIRSFETARKLRPGYAEATHNLANTYLAIGEATKAATLYKEAAEYNPTLYQSYHQLGAIAFDLKKYTEAIVYFEKAAELSPNPIQQYLGLYITYQTVGDRENAEKYLESVRLLAGTDASLLQALQQVQLQFPL